MSAPNLLVFREGRRNASGRELLLQLKEQLAQSGIGPTQEQWLRALLLAGELECGLADINSNCTAPMQAVTDRLAEAAMPDSIEATIADRFYFQRSDLPPTLAHTLRRLATFSNPAFLELQRMRLSVARTPRVIACFEDLDRYLAGNWSRRG